MAEYLQKQAKAYPQQSAHYDQLGQYAQKKLWHQLTVKLLELLKNEFFLSGKNLLDLYTEFVSKHEKRLNQLSLAVFTITAAKQLNDAAAGLKFLESVLKSVSDDKQAYLLVFMEIALRKVQAGAKREEVKPLIEEGQKLLDDYAGMSALVYSAFYRASLEYHKSVGNATKFYSDSLMFLSYTPAERLTTKEAVAFASDVGIAALIGDHIYNFGELLQHPIVNALDKTSFDWLIDLLRAFNTGSIQKFEEIYQKKFRDQNVLQKNSDFLRQKIRIMRLMELVFTKPSDARTISFKEISEICQLPVDQVELLLMKSFSIQVLKGNIDQVSQTVRVKWVQPRVLDIKQIGGMHDRLKSWADRIQKTGLGLKDSAPELFP